MRAYQQPNFTSVLDLTSPRLTDTGMGCSQHPIICLSWLRDYIFLSLFHFPSPSQLGNWTSGICTITHHWQERKKKYSHLHSQVLSITPLRTCGAWSESRSPQSNHEPTNNWEVTAPSWNTEAIFALWSLSPRKIWHEQGLWTWKRSLNVLFCTSDIESSAPYQICLWQLLSISWEINFS